MKYILSVVIEVEIIMGLGGVCDLVSVQVDGCSCILWQIYAKSIYSTHHHYTMLCCVTGQRSFEMNVTVPLFMYDSEWGIMGVINGE